MTSFSLVLDFIFCFLADSKSNWSLYIMYMFIWLSVYRYMYIYMYMCTSLNLHFVNVKCSWCPCSHEAASVHFWESFLSLRSMWVFAVLLFFPWRPSLIHVENYFLPPSVFVMTISGFPSFNKLSKETHVACTLAMHPPLTSCLAYAVVSCGYREIDGDTCDQKIPLSFVLALVCISGLWFTTLS